MSKTIENLKEAFAGESQANQKYAAYAKKAESEGQLQVAKLFRVAAHAEMIHAQNHLRALGGIKTTPENLEDAIGGENYEVTSMYPEFIRCAEEEGDKRALTTFKWAWEVEMVHEALYRKALENLANGLPALEYYICPICGYVHESGAPDRCPVCGTPRSRFEVIA